MFEIKNLEELNNSEMITITGGGPISKIIGFHVAAYIDFEIGMAIGIGNAIKKAWYSL